LLYTSLLDFAGPCARLSFFQPAVTLNHMGAMITDIEDYFTKGCGRCARFDTPDCSTRQWASGLADLRQLCLDAGLSEQVKWGHPCYMAHDRNLVIIGAFRDNFRLTFFNAALMKDPDNILERQGPNTAQPDMIRFNANDQVTARAETIRAYLAEAISYAKAGLKPPKADTQYDIPEELTDALDADPDFAEAFAALTPGRKNGYYLHIGSAKQSRTRAARVEKMRPRIFKGIGFNERL
jgi:uncharacterized protein YdeI (YjbR/CyaY-like superfamily)